MNRKLLHAFIFFLGIPMILSGQVKSVFSGDPDKYREELNVRLGPNLTPDQVQVAGSFYSKWDSTEFSPDIKLQIVDVSIKLTGRNLRTIPHFMDFLKTINTISESDRFTDFLGMWLSSVGKLSMDESLSNDILDRYFRNTVSFLVDNVIYESGPSRWKIKGNDISVDFDTAFTLKVEDVTLAAFSGRDSTEIYDVSGIYFPENNLFIGTSGIVTWEKAGYSRDSVYAEISDYSINTTRTTFSVDSAKLYHKTYFKEPVLGTLTDQASSYSDPSRAVFPRFETLVKKFLLENLYNGVNYEGGLTLEGASVKGTGQNYFPAIISLYRNDTLYIRVKSQDFLFTKNSINSSEVSASLYLENDSIFHFSLGFSYNTGTRLVSLFRNNNPVSRSPFYNSFHQLDMYFETLYWNMNESRITLSRARGASLGQAGFESLSFFRNNNFERLQGIDDYHPLYRLKQFAEWYYSETFPVAEFAKWMKRPVEAVTGLCIDLANRGFLFYDRTNNEVTIKKKVDDYINSFSRKKDYDVISISSQTSSPTDNAQLDLRNYRITINGVRNVFLSDSQRVAIYPYNDRIVVGKNRAIDFDGVVEAGLFTIFGHNFSFNYDTFKIRLQKIDSIIVFVETDERDNFGNPIVKDVQNLIQLATAELYIDDPGNKSGLRSLEQYPIINAVSYSYIFFDKLPGLNGIYKQKDFYFRIDPFSYENIDHYRNEDINLAGEFIGGNILEPSRQYLTIQEDNSFGFTMNIPDEGVPVYGSRALLYNTLTLSNKGLVGSGTLKRITSTTEAEEFRFFPDSMITDATSFTIEKDPEGRFPELNSTDVKVKWLTEKDDWIASNSRGKNFEMFSNGTLLNGKITYSPRYLTGSGTINMADSRILSNKFNFATATIQADTSDYTLKALQGDGFAFIAEDANTLIDFNEQHSIFSLNSGNSVVKFPEIEYICTMTDFDYDMSSRILSMEQRGKSSSTLMPAGELLKLDFDNLDEPTFFSVNNLRDTISFSSWKGSYDIQQEVVQAENINYIHIADALIQPENGAVVITKRAAIRPLRNAIIAVNGRHILHSANISIENSQRYSGSAMYNYVDVENNIQEISFPTITVDTSTTTANGYIPVSQSFMLSPAFSFTGDVTLSARADNLYFVGAAGIVNSCDQIKSYNIKFRASIDPEVVMIPVGEKPRDINDNLVFSGTFINIDSTHVYPAFLSERKSWSDAQMVTATGVLFYEKESGKYKIGTKEKLADATLNGPLVTFDRNFCVLSGEGKINFGADFDLLKMETAGKVIHTLDSGKVNTETIIALDFHFSEEALNIMSTEIRSIPTLSAVNINTDLNNKGMADILGVAAANRLKEEIGLFGTSRNLPREYVYELLLNDVDLYWNEPTASFRSKGKIGIGFIGTQPINVYVDGYVEIQRRRSGDMIDIYLKADQSTWYYFSYIRGVMMTQSGNNGYNSLITGIKIRDRRHPDSSTRVPYTYMIAVEDRLERFIRRMTSNENMDDINR